MCRFVIPLIYCNILFKLAATDKFENYYSKNVDYFSKLVDVWDPKVFITQWEEIKKGNGNLNVSEECEEDMGKYLNGISLNSQWALKMMDASGRYTWGLFSGNRYWIGAMDQCKEMENNYINYLLNTTGNNNDKEIIKKNYSSIPPFHVAANSVNLQIFMMLDESNPAHKITLGVCLPSNCRTDDVRMLLNFYISNKLSNRGNVTVNNVRNLNEGYTFWDDYAFVIMMITGGFVVFIVTLGTCYDIALRFKVIGTKESHNNNEIVRRNRISKYEDCADDKRDNTVSAFYKLWTIKEHNASLDLWKEKSVPKPMSEALLSFSLLLNLEKLLSLDVGHDTLAPIHGLRFISMLWIIMVHTCLIANEVSDTNIFRLNAEQDFFYQTISNGTYAVDTFFFISGCLVTFLYFRTMSKRRLSEKKITKGFVGKILQFIGLMFYRYFRLTPPYLLVIGIIQVSMKWYHAHSLIELPSLDYETCEKFWWRNALYVNTYFDMDERCMVWSWYLANDTQFYTFGIVILIIGANYLTAGAVIGIVVLISSWIVTTIITVQTQHVPTIQDPFAHYESLYDKPWTRIGPYLIGMATGWFLYRIDCKLKINKAIIVIGWTLSITTLLSIVYGLYGNTLGPISSALYTALSHSGWAISVAWILIICVTKNGGLVEILLSCKYLYPLSRLTYCVYLIHPLLTRAIILRSESSLHLSRELIAILFFGVTIISYTASLFISLFFEAPMVSFLRIFHPLRQWKNFSNNYISNNNNNINDDNNNNSDNKNENRCEA